MLATIGFIVTGICFCIFAFTFDALIAAKTKLKLHSFVYAYYALALAMAAWGLGAATADSAALKNSVLIGNALLLMGTVFMVSVLAGTKHRWWIWLTALAAAAIFCSRAYFFTPEPYMRSGILIFNTQQPVAIVIGLLFLLIWLPANIRVARHVAHAISQDRIAATYSYMYIAATLSALIFLTAEKTITVVLSFIALGACFVMLIGSNVLIMKMTRSFNDKRQ